MRTVWDGSTCRVYGKHQFTSPIECSTSRAPGPSQQVLVTSDENFRSDLVFTPFK